MLFKKLAGDKENGGGVLKSGKSFLEKNFPPPKIFKNFKPPKLIPTKDEFLKVHHKQKQFFQKIDEQRKKNFKKVHNKQKDHFKKIEKRRKHRMKFIKKNLKLAKEDLMMIKKNVKNSVKEFLNDFNNVDPEKEKYFEEISKRINKAEKFFEKGKYQMSIETFQEAVSLTRLQRDEKNENYCLKRMGEISILISESIKTSLKEETKKQLNKEKQSPPKEDESEEVSEGLSQFYDSLKEKDFILNKNDVSTDKTISSGSFGIVKAGSMKIGLATIKVAVKEISIDQTNQEEVENEVEIMAQCNYKSILQVFGCYFNKGSAFIVMELCKDSLYHVLKTTSKISQKMKIRWLLQIARGMDYLHHEKKIIHRDLKTQNVLVTSDKMCKICDFGSSRTEDSQSGTFCGTVEYLAPEQVDFSMFVNSRLLDIYSFGIIIWEVWTQTLPFLEIRKELKGNQFAMINFIFQKKSRPDLTKMEEGDAPEELMYLAEGCWEFYPKERIQSFKEVVEILESIKM